MHRRRVPVIVVSVALVLGALGVALSWNSEAARTERERAERLTESGGAASVAAPERAVVAVDAIRVELSESRVVVDIAVTLEAVRSVRVGSEVGGRIVEVPVLEHDHVARGEVLVHLDAKLPEAAVARARANLVRARSTHALATQQHGRQRNLSDKGVSSVADFDRTETEESRREAPFAGVVSEFDLDPGAYLRVGDPVARVSDLSEIEIEVGVDDRQILALELGHAARLAVDAFPGEWFDGVVAGLARTPDPATRKYPVPVRIANPQERLLPGMLGRVRFEIGDSTPVIRIPRRAVYREFEVDYVYVLEAPVLEGSVLEAGEAGAGQARARRRRIVVESVPFRPDLLDVREGLVPGDRVAASGVRDLRDGLLVRVRDRTPRWRRL